jgi:hypothetical protein
MRTLVMSLVCLTLAAFAAHAQVDYATATLRGTVRDPQGAVLSGATVTASDAEKGIKRTTTGENGQYIITGLHPRAYDVIVEMPGFQTDIHKSIVVNVGQTTIVDFHLKVSQAVESVEVTTEPPILQPDATSLPSGTASMSFPIIRGIVLPRDARAQGEISGLVVPDPAKYENIPGLQVVLVPSTSAGTLEGVVIDLGDGRKQPGNKPLTLKLPDQVAPMMVSVFLSDQLGHPIARSTLPIASAPATPASVAAAGPLHCTMPPVTTPGGVQVIHEANNRMSGDSTTMNVVVDDKPATIVAATPGAVYWGVPETLAPGPHQVTLTPGPGAAPVVLPMQVLGLQMAAEKTALLRGQSTMMHVTITGLDKLPPSAWQSAPPPSDLVNVEGLIQRAKGFHPPKPHEPGAVMLLLENQSPSQIRMGKEGDRIVLQLHQKDFANGPYSYQDKLQSLQSGGFSITGTVVAFLKDVQGSK